MTPCSVSLSHLGCQSSCAGASHPEGLFVSDDFLYPTCEILPLWDVPDALPCCFHTRRTWGRSVWSCGLECSTSSSRIGRWAFCSSSGSSPPRTCFYRYAAHSDAHTWKLWPTSAKRGESLGQQQKHCLSEIQPTELGGSRRHSLAPTTLNPNPLELHKPYFEAIDHCSRQRFHISKHETA